MNDVLRDLINKTCIVYIDDIVWSKDFQTHLLHLQQTFDRFEKANLTLKASKCQFAVKRVKYLAHILSSTGVEPDPEKISVVADYQPPKKKPNRSGSSWVWLIIIGLLSKAIVISPSLCITWPRRTSHLCGMRSVRNVLKLWKMHSPVHHAWLIQTWRNRSSWQPMHRLLHFPISWVRKMITMLNIRSHLWAVPSGVPNWIMASQNWRPWLWWKVLNTLFEFYMLFLPDNIYTVNPYGGHLGPGLMNILHMYQWCNIPMGFRASVTGTGWRNYRRGTPPSVKTRLRHCWHPFSQRVRSSSSSVNQAYQAIMPTRCCVPLCSNRGGIKFPKNDAMRKLWVQAIRRVGNKSGAKWEPKAYMVVCHSHFTSADYHNANETLFGKSTFLSYIFYWPGYWIHVGTFTNKFDSEVLHWQPIPVLLAFPHLGNVAHGTWGKVVGLVVKLHVSEIKRIIRTAGLQEELEDSFVSQICKWVMSCNLNIMWGTLECYQHS